MSTEYADTAPFLPLLEDLWRRNQIPTHLYRAFFYARGRNVWVPATVGALRTALAEPEAPDLRRIPTIGPASIARLHALFDETAQDAQNRAA